MDSGFWGYVINVISVLSKVGVAIFFFVSGYLLKYNKKPIGKFFLNKIFTILIPWLFTGTLVYLYVCLRKGGLSLTSFLQFLLGYGSYLWFLPVILFLQMIWLVVGKYKIVSLILPIITFVNYLILYFVFDLNLYGYAYLNPFNWFFSLVWGICLTSIDYWKKLQSY